MSLQNLNDDSRKKGLLSDDRPSFFKILHSSQSHDSLEIPPCFMNKISEEGVHAAILKGPKNVSQDIKISCAREGIFCLKNGWKEFLNRNDLGDMNGVLIFRYNGNMHFDVSAFDSSGGEILDLEPVAGTSHDQVRNCPSGKRKRGRPKKTSVTSLDILQPNSPENSLDHQIACVEPNSQDIRMEVKTLEKKTSRGSSKIIEAEDYGIRKKNRSNQQMEVSSTSLLQDEVGENVSKAVAAFTSPFPFFSSCMRSYHVSRNVMILNIPITFNLQHFGRFKGNIKLNLRNHKGKCWVVNAVAVTKTTRKLSGGWRAFVLDNMIKVGDVCIFELVGRRDMQVHIVRAMDGFGTAGTSQAQS